MVKQIVLHSSIVSLQMVWWFGWRLLSYKGQESRFPHDCSCSIAPWGHCCRHIFLNCRKCSLSLKTVVLLLLWCLCHCNTLWMWLISKLFIVVVFADSKCCCCDACIIVISYEYDWSPNCLLWLFLQTANVPGWVTKMSKKLFFSPCFLHSACIWNGNVLFIILIDAYCR